MEQFLSSVGQLVEDVEEESFLLFTRPVPSAKNLGFIDSRAPSVEVTLHDTEYTIQQSPSLLSSRRAGGTTGAVIWKITPLFAEWISSVSANALWTHPATPLPSHSLGRTTVVELGCGIAGLLALAMGPHVGFYVATDQEYVRRVFRENLEGNKALAYKNSGSGQRGKNRRSGSGQRNKRSPVKGATASTTEEGSNISFAPFDWESDSPETLKQSVGIPLTTPETPDHEDKGFDVLFSCDCVYNEALIAPFVRACADICRLRPAYRPTTDTSEPNPDPKPTVCIIGQQQRTPDVFEAWLEETLKVFWVWRLDDAVLRDGLRAGSGYVVHLLLLR